MNEFFAATLYGVIQGVTEFLPVSSSGHLALIPFFTGLEDPGVLFDLAMHVGTAIAVIVAFWSKIKELIRQSLVIGRVENTQFARNFWIATFVTVVNAFGVENFAERFGRNPYLIAFNLVFFGALLWAADRQPNAGCDLTRESNWKKAFMMGLAQSLAVFPGVSRSGITLTAARNMGMSRVDAGAFSFLLSLPIILGGFVYKLLRLLSTGALPHFNYSTMFLGILISFIVGLITIRFFMSMLNRFGLGIYFWYRLALAMVVVLASYKA